MFHKWVQIPRELFIFKLQILQTDYSGIRGDGHTTLNIKKKQLQNSILEKGEFYAT